MKRTILSLLTLLFAINLFAQFGAPPLVSPEINGTDVTFRLRAPKAIKVELNGDFLPKKEIETPMGKMSVPAPVEMVEGEGGVWEYTVKDVSPDYCSYTFTVDGQKMLDPSNVKTVRDGQNFTNYFIIAGEKSDLFLEAEAKKGTLSKVWYPSNAFGAERRMSVYTPYGYGESNKKYPVFYLQHGGGGDEDAWPTLGRACQILDNLIAQGKAEPMIVVMPNADPNSLAAQDVMDKLPGPSIFSLGMESEELHSGGNYTKDLVEDIIPYVESHYNVIKKKESRAIAGLSMGGIYTLYTTPRHPELFDYIGVLSMGFTPERDVKAELTPIKDAGYKLYWVGCGETDMAWANAERLLKGLDEMDMEHIYFGEVGGHNWDTWRVCLKELAPLLFK
ncbi:alpha/beta hydrolase-fold protein [Draconibacterium sp. IB214405]|uniref:esterase n=1 Tax=Draconibacterium sp. IB214405 TaxID=3097352 RepID=UPI002A125E7B|nr:alpha/beta hydrolase-fold protein [Draconibacterium sp. IB214405]MDX8338953.1 alpha/beta hydrolase-fold protein [Draconibacterium sp. IB214405]